MRTIPPAGVHFPPPAPVAATPLEPNRRVALPPIVPVELQRSTLTLMEARVDEILADGRNAVGELDLDLTTLLPIRRVEAALRLMATQYDEPALLRPEDLAMIPGYTETAFPAWVREGGWGEKHPEWLGLSYLPNYWSAAPLASDTVAPGLADFLGRLFKKRGPGGERFFAAFNSGRGAGNPDDSMAPFRRAGIDIALFDAHAPRARQAVLFIGNAGGDAETKRQRQGQMLSIGKVAFVVDDRKTNRDAVLSGLEALGVPRREVVDVAVAAPRFSTEPPTRNHATRISTFVRV